MVASGQEINFHKSSLCFAKKHSEDTKRIICNILGMNRMSPTDRYLGLPSFWRRFKVEALNFILERMKFKARSWKQNILSMAGREILIKVILSSIPSYMMYYILFPASFWSMMISLIVDFWLSGDNDKKKTHRVSWDKLTESKKLGGLGFKHFRVFNMALLAKQA